MGGLERSGRSVCAPVAEGSKWWAHDYRVGFVDAAVLVVERLKEPKVAILDRRHLSFCGRDMLRP